MVREAVIINLGPNGGNPVRYACNDSDAIDKGQLLFLDVSGSRKVSGASLVDAPAAGIATHEKVAADGQTQISVYTEGIFDLHAGLAAPVGRLLKISGGNIVVPTAEEGGNIVSGLVLCKAVEAAGSANTVIACKLVMV